MTYLRTTAQQALEALESTIGNINPERGYVDELENEVTAATKALRAALEQPGPEPVARICTWHKNGEQHAELLLWCDGADSLPDGEHSVYTAPPRREWQSLTDEEIDDLSRTMVKGNKSVNWLSRAIRERGQN